MSHLSLIWVVLIFGSGGISSDLEPASSILGTYYKNPFFDQCDREQCLAVEEIFLQNINADLEPCDDFFKYACGKNLTNELRSAWKENDHGSEYSRILHEILTSDLNSQWNYLKPLKLERDIYKACEKGIRNEKEKAYYSEILEKYNANRLDDNFHYNSDVNEWETSDSKYARNGFGFAFFDVEIVERDVATGQESQRFIQISPSSDKIVDFKELLIKKYNTGADQKYGELKSFIDQLIEIKPSKHNSESDSQPEAQTISTWQEKYDAEGYLQHSKINFRSVLNGLFGTIGRTIYDDDKVIVKNEDYFYALARFLNGASIDAIVNFIHLRFISKTIGIVDDEYREYSLIPEVDGLKCTPGLLIGTAHVYARTHFPSDTKISVEEIFDNVRNYAKDKIENYRGQPRGAIISQESKRFLNSDVVVGYPDWMINDDIISNFYRGGFSASETYLKNQLECIKILQKNMLTALNDKEYPILRMDEFYKSFMVENWEIPNGGVKIIIPANAFNEKDYRFVSAQLENSLNYGSAGTEIASKLYHRWLTNIDYSARSPKCIADQLPQKIVKSKRSDLLNKAVSYLLGLQNSDAVRPNKHSYPIQFPRFGALTESRFFFLSFAESVCRSQLQQHEAEFFINFAVSNTKEFSEAFQCYSDDRSYPMSRTDTCSPLSKN